MKHRTRQTYPQTIDNAEYCNGFQCGQDTNGNDLFRQAMQTDIIILEQQDRCEYIEEIDEYQWVYQPVFVKINTGFVCARIPST